MKKGPNRFMQQLLEDLAAVQPRPASWEGLEREDQIALIVLAAIEASHAEGVELAEWPGFACAAAEEILKLETT